MSCYGCPDGCSRCRTFEDRPSSRSPDTPKQIESAFEAHAVRYPPHMSPSKLEVSPDVFQELLSLRPDRHTPFRRHPIEVVVVWGLGPGKWRFA